MSSFINLIKKYRLDEIIYILGNLSIKMFEKNKSYTSIPIETKQFGHLKRVEIQVAIWDILQIQYIAVCNSNDYRSEEVKSDQELFDMINQYRIYENENTSSDILKDASLKDIYKYMFGISSEQFIFFNMSWVFQSFNRNYHILINNKKQTEGSGIDIDEIIIEKFGITSDEFITVMLIIFWLCMNHPDPLSAPEELYKKNNDTVLKQENIKKIIEYYSCSYQDIRQSSTKKQILYSKPFIKTDRDNKFIASSMQLVSMILADGLYWIVRDYYSEKKSQKFVNAFGYIFEDYFCELANRYLDKEQFIKLPQTNQKSADYRIEVDNAILIIEQKSALLGITAKQQVPDFECINRFYKRNIIEAYEQIQGTIESINEKKPVLKIILLYENLFNTGFIEASIPEIFEKDRRCWIMTIRDLEALLVTNKKDSGKFFEVINKLVTKKQVDIKSAESALSLMDEMKLFNYTVFEGEYDYFSKAMKRFGDELGEYN